MYAAGTSGNPATAPDPTTQGFTEIAPSGSSVQTTDVSPDPGTGLNAWQVDDAGSGSSDSLSYEKLFGPEGVAVARHAGWELFASMRLVAGSNYCQFMEFSTGLSTVHERYHLWMKEEGAADVRIKVLGPAGVEYVLTGARDGNYHTLTMTKSAGQLIFDAELYFDDVFVGDVTPAVATGANANAGMRWGSGHGSNTGTGNWNMVRFELGSAITGFPYCFGDGSGTPCPCGNTGGTDQGCANSTMAGAVMTAGGSNSVGSDDLFFDGFNLLPNQPGLLFVGNNAVNNGNGNAFGDGLRCAGQGVIRIGVRVPNPNGEATWGPNMGGTGGWQPGDQRFFQIWYRDPSGSPCGEQFNLSHGFEVNFQG